MSPDAAPPDEVGSSGMGEEEQATINSDVAMSKASFNVFMSTSSIQQILWTCE